MEDQIIHHEEVLFLFHQKVFKILKYLKIQQNTQKLSKDQQVIVILLLHVQPWEIKGRENDFISLKTKMNGKLAEHFASNLVQKAMKIGLLQMIIFYVKPYNLIKLGEMDLVNLNQN